MSEPLAAVQAVREWAVDFFRESEAMVETVLTHQRLDILIPKPLSTRLGTDFVEIPIDQESGRIPNPLMPGSALLDQLMEEALCKGRSAEWYLWAEIKKTLTLEDVLRKAAFHGARPKSIVTKFVQVPHVLFHFQVSYVSDDKQEEIVPVFIHPFLRRGLPFGPYKSAMPAQGNELNLEAMPLPPVESVYEMAKAAIPFLTEARRTIYQEREQKRFEREAQRVRKYFSRGRKDIMQRLDRQGLENEKRASLTAKIRALELEEKRKLGDLEEKHKLLVQVRLVNAAVIHVPQIQAEIAMEGRGLAAPAVLTVFWDPTLKETLMPACPLCRQEMTRIAICPRCLRAVCPTDLERCL